MKHLSIFPIKDNRLFFFIYPIFVFTKLFIMISIVEGMAAMKLSFPEEDRLECARVMRESLQDPVAEPKTELLQNDLSQEIPTTRICPKGKWYHNQTESCWPTKVQGPCPPTLVFYPQGKVYGDCECPRDQINHTVWVYNLSLNRCFKSYEQAYCKSGEWLIFGNDGEPVCVPNKCEDKQREHPEENETHPVVLYNGVCARILKPSEEGNCLSPCTVTINLRSGKPTCSFDVTSRFIVPPPFKCRPGTVKDRLGKCRPVNSKVTFRPSS